MSKKLTDKQDRFCYEYMVDMNATQAAIRAGYSEKTAKDIAAQNLAKLYIQERITELKTKQQSKTNKTLEDVIKALENIAFFNIKSVYTDWFTLSELNELPEDITYPISEIATREVYRKTESGEEIIERLVKLKFESKQKALETLEKYKVKDQPSKAINVNIEFSEAPQLNDVEGFEDLKE